MSKPCDVATSSNGVSNVNVEHHFEVEGMSCSVTVDCTRRRASLHVYQGWTVGPSLDAVTSDTARTGQLSSDQRDVIYV